MDWNFWEKRFSTLDRLSPPLAPIMAPQSKQKKASDPERTLCIRIFNLPSNWNLPPRHREASPFLCHGPSQDWYRRAAEVRRWEPNAQSPSEASCMSGSPTSESKCSLCTILEVILYHDGDPHVSNWSLCTCSVPQKKKTIWTRLIIGMNIGGGHFTWTTFVDIFFILTIQKQIQIKRLIIGMNIGGGHFTIFFPCSIASKYLTSFTFLKKWINSGNFDEMTKLT